MGYYVSSAFAVSPNDKHSYFIYFIPGQKPYDRLSTLWINEWVHLHFSEIAQHLGPTGVIVSPPRGASWKEDEIGRLELEWPFTGLSKGEDQFLYSQMPFLLLSRSPLQHDLTKHKEGIAINLVKCANEQELACVFDIIIAGIREDNWQHIIDNFPLQERAEEPDVGGSWFEWLKMLELKPNVFGLGVNLNAALDAVGKKLFPVNSSRRGA
jgi:hypothetical protein